MRAVIKIQMDNAAFGDNPEQELSRILEELAAKVKVWGANDNRLLDINGNHVGELAIMGRPRRYREREAN